MLVSYAVIFTIILGASKLLGVFDDQDSSYSSQAQSQDLDHADGHTRPDSIFFLGYNIP